MRAEEAWVNLHPLASRVPIAARHDFDEFHVSPKVDWLYLRGCVGCYLLPVKPEVGARKVAALFGGLGRPIELSEVGVRNCVLHDSMIGIVSMPFSWVWWGIQQNKYPNIENTFLLSTVFCRSGFRQ